MKEKIKIICKVVILIGILFPIFSFAQNTEKEIFIFRQNSKEITLSNERQLYCTPSSFITQPLKPTENTKAIILYQIKNPAGTWFRIAINKEPIIKGVNTIYSGHCVLEPAKEEIGFKYWVKEWSIPEDIRLQILDIEQFAKDSLELQSFRVDGNYIKGKIRKCPDSSCEIEWMVGSGGIATVIEEKGDWFRVVVSNFDTSRVDKFAEEGWVYKDFIPDNIKTKLENYKQTITQKEQITPPSLNVESQPAQTNWDIFYYGIVVIFIVIIFSTLYLFRKKIKDIFRFKLNAITLPKIKLKQRRLATSLFIVLVVTTGIIGISYGTVYYQTYKVLKNAEQLTKDEKYNEATEKLESIQNEWFIKTLGIKKQEISSEIENNRKLDEDKLEYIQGIEEFNKESWEKAKELLSKVSEISPYYQDAKRKIEEAQNNIFQYKITEAIAKTTEESKRTLMEAQNRIEAEARQSQARTAELEQKIAELQQKQQFQSWTGYKASEIVETLGKYIVKVACFDRYGDMMTGSGIIYTLDSKEETIILTNYHVIENADSTLQYPCAVFYSSDPTKGFTDFYFAEPVYYPSVVSLSTMRLIDFVFLRIEAKFSLPEYGGIKIIPNASFKITDYVPIVCSEDKIKVGEEMVVLGYPTIGGEYLTATEGIISGYEGTYYLTTSAKVERGGSGGGAFLKSTGCLVGMPTFVRLGRIEAFARLINMSYLQQNYLSKIWGTTTEDASDLIFCNGQFWYSCLTGQKFYCPSVGDPYCY